MSEYICRGECLETVAKVNCALVKFQERIRQIRKDMEKLEAENKALREKIQALEIRHEGLLARTSGWQEGFGESVREQFRRIDERFVKLLASDDSADFEIRQWIEEVIELRKDVSALEKRVTGVEQTRPIVISDRTPPLMPTPFTKEVRCEEPTIKPPFKFTCQTKEKDYD